MREEICEICHSELEFCGVNDEETKFIYWCKHCKIEWKFDIE